MLDAPPEDMPAHAFWFGEDQARYLVTVPADRAEAVMQRVQAASVLVHRIGSTGGATHRHSGRARHRHQDAGRAVRRLVAGLYGGAA